MAAGDVEIRHNLRAVLIGLRAADKTFAREIRKQLREAGEEMVAEQGRILDSESPVSLSATGGEGTFTRGARATIKAGLKVRAGAGSGRYGGYVRVITTAPDGIPAKPFNAPVFRHPTFGNTGEWVDQEGIGYFTRGVKAGASSGRAHLLEVIDKALDEIPDNPRVQ
ncbi:MAG TPA: hypothetical protein VGK41_04885, partial [Solirubrobacterales bacterium]